MRCLNSGQKNFLCIHMQICVYVYAHRHIMYIIIYLYIYVHINIVPIELHQHGLFHTFPSQQRLALRGRYCGCRN